MSVAYNGAPTKNTHCNHVVSGATRLSVCNWLFTMSTMESIEIRAGLRVTAESLEKALLCSEALCRAVAVKAAKGEVAYGMGSNAKVYIVIVIAIVAAGWSC